MPLYDAYQTMWRLFSRQHSFEERFNIYAAIKGHKKNRKNNRSFSARKRRQIGVK